MNSPAPFLQRKEGDEYVMVDYLSELVDNGGMSDISLPPLPSFDHEGGSPSEADDADSGGSGSGSEHEEEDEEGGQGSYVDDDERTTLGVDEKAPSVCDSEWDSYSDSDCSSSQGGGRGGDIRIVRGDAASSSGGGGRKGLEAVDRGGSGRRASGRACHEDTVSPPSVSPAPRTRTRPLNDGGLTERSGRRLSDESPHLQSAPETSDAYDSEAFFSSYSDRKAGIPGGASSKRTGVQGYNQNYGGGDSSGGGGGSSSGFVPFYLSEVPCVPSETVSEITESAEGSPLRVQAGAGALQRKFSVGDSSKSSAMAVSAASAEAAAAAASGEPGEVGTRATTTTASPVLRTEDSDGSLAMTADTESLTTAAAAAAAQFGTSTSTHSSGSAAAQAVMPSGVPPTGRRKPPPLTLPDNRANSGNTTTTTGGNMSGRRRQHTNSSGSGTAAGGDVGAGGDDRSNNGSVSDVTGSEAWSCLSPRGMTPSSLVPLGPMLDWDESDRGGGGGGLGGLGGGCSTNMSASLAGFAGYKSALLEARRAAAAEEQGEFWQRRASAAERVKGDLERVVAEQKAQIAELQARCASLSRLSTGAGATTSGEREEAVSPPGDTSTPSPVVGPVSNSSRSSSSSPAGTKGARSCEGRPERGRSGDDSGARKRTEDEGGVAAALEAIGGIAFTRFSVGQVSMFFPTPEGNFLAFNVGCPGHFLSKESQELVGRDEHFRSYYVLGRIIEIQDTVCEKGNPFKLPHGQRIRVVSVESITPDLRAAGVVPVK